MPGYTPPAIYIANVARAGYLHTCDGPNDPRLLLAAFSSALKSALNWKNCIVQGAIYTPLGGSIFIDTDDEEWNICCATEEDMKRMVWPDGIAPEATTTPPVPTSKISETTSSMTAEAHVPIFNVTDIPCKKFHADSDSNTGEGIDRSRQLLKLFIDAIDSVMHKSGEVLSASFDLGAADYNGLAGGEGANIMMRDPRINF